MNILLLENALPVTKLFLTNLIIARRFYKRHRSTAKKKCYMVQALTNLYIFVLEDSEWLQRTLHGSLRINKAVYPVQ